MVMTASLEPRLSFPSDASMHDQVGMTRRVSTRGAVTKDEEVEQQGYGARSVGSMVCVGLAESISIHKLHPPMLTIVGAIGEARDGSHDSHAHTNTYTYLQGILVPRYTGRYRDVLALDRSTYHGVTHRYIDRRRIDRSFSRGLS